MHLPTPSLSSYVTCTAISFPGLVCVCRPKVNIGRFLNHFSTSFLRQGSFIGLELPVQQGWLLSSPRDPPSPFLDAGIAGTYRLTFYSFQVLLLVRPALYQLSHPACPLPCFEQFFSLPAHTSASSVCLAASSQKPGHSVYCPVGWPGGLAWDGVSHIVEKFGGQNTQLPTVSILVLQPWPG